MLTREEADNLLDESKNELVEMLCNMSYQIDMLNDKLTYKDKEIERLEKVSSDLFIEGLIIEGEQDKKARSIVAMLFWHMKRDQRIYRSANRHTKAQAELYYFCSKDSFTHAYAMLKDKQ